MDVSVLAHLQEIERCTIAQIAHDVTKRYIKCPWYGDLYDTW